MDSNFLKLYLILLIISIFNNFNYDLYLIDERALNFHINVIFEIQTEPFNNTNA